MSGEEKSVHEKIKLVRQTKGLTQEEVASKLGMSANAYGDIERGCSDPKLSKLEQISEILGVNLSELLATNDRWILNLACEVKKSTWIQGESSAEFQQIKFELEKQQLLNAEKDKEISYLKEIIELMKAK
jgi:transcriptional regulator with XRE-family HTH domain